MDKKVVTVASTIWVQPKIHCLRQIHEEQGYKSDVLYQLEKTDQSEHPHQNFRGIVFRHMRY